MANNPVDGNIVNKFIKNVIISTLDEKYLAHGRLVRIYKTI